MQFFVSFQLIENNSIMKFATAVSVYLMVRSVHTEQKTQKKLLGTYIETGFPKGNLKKSVKTIFKLIGSLPAMDKSIQHVICLLLVMPNIPCNPSATVQKLKNIKL